MSQGAGEKVVLDTTVEDESDNEIEIDLGTDEGEVDGGERAALTNADEGKQKGDGRISNRAIEEGEEEETPEQRRERRREEAKRRREAQRNYAQQDHSIIAALTEALKETQEQVKQLGGQIAEMSTQRVAETRDHWVRTAKRLRAQYVRLHDSGEASGEQLLDLQDQYNKAVQFAHHFNGELEKRQSSLRTQTQPQEQERSAPQAEEQEDPVKAMTLRNGAIFMRKHSWYDPNGGDKDSLLVRKLDQAVFNDGFRPHTREYWMELEKRMAEQGLIDEDDGGSQPQPRQQQAQEQPRRPDGTFAPKKTAGSPPVGGRVQTGGKQTVTIPPELRTYMEQAGIWNDKEKRRRVVTEYYKRINAQQGGQR